MASGSCPDFGDALRAFLKDLRKSAKTKKASFLGKNAFLARLSHRRGEPPFRIAFVVRLGEAFRRGVSARRFGQAFRSGVSVNR